MSKYPSWWSELIPDTPPVQRGDGGFAQVYGGLAELDTETDAEFFARLDGRCRRPSLPTKTILPVSLGIYLGQKIHPTAICVAERQLREPAPKTREEEIPLGRTHLRVVVTQPPDPGIREKHFVLRHLEQLPAGTSFPEAADRVAEIAVSLLTRTDLTLSLYLDATGLGEPVVRLFQERLRGPYLTAVYFNHGDRKVQEPPGKIILGKAYLVAQLQTLLQTGRLHLPTTEPARHLATELLEYEIQVDEKANERYGAFPVGTQDDLVTALGLAVLYEY